MTCAPGDQLNIEIRNRWESTVSMEYNLDDWQYACIEDDFLSIYFGFAKREFFESKDLCFSNEAYIDQYDEPPFVVNNNCYGPSYDSFRNHAHDHDLWYDPENAESYADENNFYW